jgi:O-antigen/teichoic acid export membrane protein
LITVPYISRVLGPEGIGLYSYSYSITQYFIIIGSIGLTMYGTRQIAYSRDDRKAMSNDFWSIVIIRSVTLGSSLIIYILMISTFKNNRLLFLIQGLTIFAALIDISWLYSGTEEFKKIIIRNLLVKIAGIAGILIFVKEREHLILYVWLNVGMSVVGNLTLFLWLPRIVDFNWPKKALITSHIIPSLRLFLPQIATQIYLLLDKTLLGLLANMEQVGFYTQSEKLVKVVLSLVASVSTVVIPRMSNIYAKRDFVKMTSFLNNALVLTSFFTVPFSVGLAAITHELVPWFFGPGYEPVQTLLPLLSSIIFIISISTVIGTQYLLPSDRMRGFTISLFAGAGINLVFNFMLIPHYGALGAVISTILAESIVSLIQFSLLKHEIDIASYVKNFIQFTLASLMIYVVVKILGTAMGAGFFTTLIQILTGACVYFASLLLMKNSIALNILKSGQFSRI